MIRNVVKFLVGKKTYLICIAGVVYGWGIRKQWWPSDTDIWYSLGFTGVATLRAAIARLFRLVQAESLNAPQPGRHIQP